jgi:TolB protein
MLVSLVVAAAASLPLAGDPAPLTPTEDAYPVVSPDGKTLLFQSNRLGRWALFLADADGKNVRAFLDSRDDPSVPAWSPDGRRVSFVANADGQTEIFVINADGSGRRRLTHQPGDDSHPHWSTDGRIFFNSARATPDLKADWARQHHNVFSMNADGGDVRQHTRCQTVCTYAVPSPDVRRIAFRKVIDAPGLDWALRNIARNSEVVVADIDGANEINVTRHAAYDGWPMWSPDGKWIVFSSNRTGRPNAGQLFAVREDGTNLTQLTDSARSYVQHSFAPDGLSLYASLTTEALDWSWTYSHVVRVPALQLRSSQ